MISKNTKEKVNQCTLPLKKCWPLSVQLIHYRAQIAGSLSGFWQNAHLCRGSNESTGRNTGKSHHYAAVITIEGSES